MKKFLALLLALMMILCLTACGSSAGSGNDAGSADTEAAADETAEDSDKDVSVTVPATYLTGEDGDSITQEELDEMVEDGQFISATLNDDGSVTYVMTAKEHKELMKTLEENIDETLEGMVGSEDYPNITSIEHNDDYTKFTVETESEELSEAESFSILTYYILGGCYNAYNGTEVSNIHVDFVSADSGDVIDSADSKDLDDIDWESIDWTAVD